MNHGDVKCSGSPLFLKNLYGSGYRLTASKADNFKEIDFLKIINNNVFDFKIETNIAGEIKVLLPYNAIKNVPNLLNEIEQNKDALGVTGYGITSPSIEEVFLK